MNEYRAYILGTDGHIERRIEFLCESDEAAKEQAKGFADDHDVELWQLKRRICEFKAKPSREKETRQVVQEYVDDQRAFVEKLRRLS